MDTLTQMLVYLCTQHTDGLISDFEYATGVINAGCDSLTLAKAAPAQPSDAYINTYATRVH